MEPNLSDTTLFCVSFFSRVILSDTAFVIPECSSANGPAFYQLRIPVRLIRIGCE